MPDSTEARILQAATEVFYRKGLEGARMQEIADEAGINKAMLHYYFRSKNKLFERIFLDALSKVIPKIVETLGSDLPLQAKFEQVSNYYHDLLLQRPQLPVFVFQTLQTKPERLLEFMLSQDGFQPLQAIQSFTLQLKAESDAGRIRPIDPRHLFLNLVSACVFPFMVRPLMVRVFAMEDEAFVAFVNQRRKLVPELLMASLQPSSA